jgi:protein disulfide-isomerase A6
MAMLGTQVVVAKVDADKYRDLGTDYGVSGFPTFKFFPKGSTTAEDYNGGREAKDFIEFLNDKAGTKRMLGGTLTADAGTAARPMPVSRGCLPLHLRRAGRVPELDELAKKFMTNTASRDAILAEAQKLTADGDVFAKYYVKVWPVRFFGVEGNCSGQPIPQPCLTSGAGR